MQADAVHAGGAHAPAPPRRAAAGLLQVTDLWFAATRFDAPAVRHLLQHYAFAPDTPDPTGNHLVLTLAGMKTPAPRKDAALAQVLQALFDAGWCHTVQRPESGDNALHLLARHDPGNCVRHRLRVITEAKVASPAVDNMLTVVNTAGGTAAKAAQPHRSDIVIYLHIQLLQIQIRVERMHGGGGGPEEDALLNLHVGMAERTVE